jgi:uncharacterized membrane protein
MGTLMKKIVLISSLFFSILLSTNTGAASYAYYGSLDDVGTKKDWTEVLSYKYAKGKLLIIQQDGKTLDLNDGVYEFDDGKQYLVKDGAVIDKDKDKEKKDKKKEDKKDKLKDLKL